MFTVLAMAQIITDALLRSFLCLWGCATLTLRARQIDNMHTLCWEIYNRRTFPFGLYRFSTRVEFG